HDTLFFSSAATHYSHISSSVFFLYTFSSSSISTHSIYAGIFTSSSSAISTRSNYTGISSRTYHSSWIPYSKLSIILRTTVQSLKWRRRRTSSNSIFAVSAVFFLDGLSAGVVIRIAIGGVALLVRRNEKETKKMLTTFLFHLLLIWNVLAFLSRRTLRWTTATMAATKRNTTVSSCLDVTTTATHHITFYIGTGLIMQKTQTK
ncbi:unnamed protein product, partial [Brassica oleracea]